MLRMLRRRRIERHRARVVAGIPRDTTDHLAALLVIETDETTARALAAALNERRSITLTLAHQQCWHMTPAEEVDPGPSTSPMV